MGHELQLPTQELLPAGRLAGLLPFRLSDFHTRQTQWGKCQLSMERTKRGEEDRQPANPSP